MSTDQTDSVQTDSIQPDAVQPDSPAREDSSAPEDSSAQDDPSAQPDSVVPGVVLELIEQSETIQGWMGRLADHADEDYPGVLERVEDDYRNRLDGVAGELAEHRPDLVASLEDRQGTVVSLRSDRDSHVADLEEVRLRHAVGEFSETEWDTHRTRIEAWLDEVDSRLEVEEGAVSELAAALDRIDASGPPRSSAAVGSGGAFTSEGFVSSEGAFTSEGFVEAPRARAGSGGDGSPSWSAVLSKMEEGHSDAAGGAPTAGKNGSADSDELDFVDAVSTNDLDKLDPIVAATRDREV